MKSYPYIHKTDDEDEIYFLKKVYNIQLFKKHLNN